MHSVDHTGWKTDEGEHKSCDLHQLQEILQRLGTNPILHTNRRTLRTFHPVGCDQAHELASALVVGGTAFFFNKFEVFLGTSDSDSHWIPRELVEDVTVRVRKSLSRETLARFLAGDSTDIDSLNGINVERLTFHLQNLLKETK